LIKTAVTLFSFKELFKESKILAVLRKIKQKNVYKSYYFILDHTTFYKFIHNHLIVTLFSIKELFMF